MMHPDIAQMVANERNRERFDDSRPRVARWRARARKAITKRS